MAVTVKSTSVNFADFSLPICHILTCLAKVHLDKSLAQPVNLVITSANDSVHKPDSKHYKNMALDLRSKSFKSEPDKAEFMSELAKQLGPKFTVIYEYPGQSNEHFHIQVRKGASWP